MKQKVEFILHKALLHCCEEQQLSLPDDYQIHIERPKDLQHGDFSSNVAMTLCKFFKLNPKILAEAICKHLDSSEIVAHAKVAGPGFINITLSDEALQNQLLTLWDTPNCGIQTATTPQTVIVDYSSPNLAKEMHVGHLRSTIIGDALAHALTLKGHHVIRQNHVGDWGTQFGMLLAHLEDEAQTDHADVALTDLEIFYKAAKQRFDEEPGFADRARQWVVALQSGDAHCHALWSKFIKISLSHCQALYDQLGVSLKKDDVRPESAYNDLLPKVLERLQVQGLLTSHEGAQCVFLEGFKGKDNEPLPIIVQKKDGGFLYASTDLAALYYRQHVLHADRILYVVDARQSLHFQQIFALAYRAGFVNASTSLEHVSTGMVLDNTGKPFKSRMGGVTKLADLVKEGIARAKTMIESKPSTAVEAHGLNNTARVIGIAAIKYADLSKNRTSDYVFDWDSMLTFEGNTAPYLLYATTRIYSLLQKAHWDEQLWHGPWKFSAPQEKALAKILVQYPEIIDSVVQKASPHLLCTYLYELAGTFSTFYEACPILNLEEKELKQSRLGLVKLTLRILEQGLSVLGIQTLQKM